MKIRTKFMLYTCLSVLIILSIFTAYLLNQQGDLERERLKNKIKRTNKLITSVNEKPLRDFAIDKVTVNCDGFMEDDEIAGIKVVAQYGRTRYYGVDSSDMDSAQHILEDFDVIDKEQDNKKLADITVTYTRSKINKKLAKIRNNMISLTLFTLALLVLIFFAISRIISKPIQAIIASLQKVDQGDLNHRLNLTSNDEFKEIQNHFNTMVGSIKDKKEQLESINYKLVAEIEERQRTMQILSNIISNIPYSIFWKNTQLAYIGCNENFAKDQGLDSQAIINKKDIDIAPNQEIAAFRKRIDDQVMSTQKPIIELEHAELKANQEVIYSTSKVPLYNENQQVIGLLGIYADITERRKKEEELRKAKEAAEAANKAKSEFLANMSHEIRTPMNGIMGMAEILSHTEMDGDQQKYVELIKTSTDNLLHVINDILDISRIEASKIVFEEENFNLEETLNTIVDTFSVSAHEKNLELIYSLDPKINATLIGDSGRLKQILINIIGNAVKFTDTGEIAIEITHKETTEAETILQFSIKDTGIGIPEDQLEKIFGTFAQVEAAYNRRFSGTGLGLTISKRLVEMMGGSIFVESTLDKGSNFHFTLPFKYKTQKQIAQPKFTKDLKDLSVLVLEPNASLRQNLTQILENMEAKANIFAQADEALTHLEEEKITYDVILLNLHLEGLDSLAFLEKISPTKSATILLINSKDAKGEKPKIQKAKSLGAITHLAKPLKVKELYQKILNALKENKAKKQFTKYEGSDVSVVETIEKKSLKVLVAEDHLLIQNITRIMLKKKGHEVIIVSNGQEAIDIFDNTFDLIIMDIQMPIVDGVTATNVIREKERGKRIPIIALTAHAQAGDRERFLESGMDDYVSKPYKAEDFYDVLNKYVALG